LAGGEGGRGQDLGINLTKDMKDFYNENYKSLKKN
jgi:hypothetical protein